MTDTAAPTDQHAAPVDVDEVARRRRARGLTIAAVVPARDEADTVAGVVAGLQELVARDVLEEVVLVDGASTDGTRELARAAGARVLAQQARPRGLAAGGGKGDAMWQGVAATDTDVVLFVDADVVDCSADFVLPLLLPLLDDDRVKLVKAAYDRPLGASSSGGGRVTELVARPLLALLWPELDFLAQPLAGEYAARRDLLASVPFVQGYGVELALLVDTVARHGAEAVRQVDLGARRHAHQSLDALGRMATEILAVALDRAEQQGRRAPTAALLRQPLRDADGRLAQRDHHVTVRQRPPLAG